MNSLYVMYGDNPEEMAAAILKKMQIKEDLQKVNREEPLIGIKPNLVVAKPSHSGATTSPQLVKGVIKYLKTLGFMNIVILESSWVGERNTGKAFKVCGYEEISREYQIPLIDLKKDGFQVFNVDGVRISICKQALKIDYLINMPVLKAHCQTKLTCALKNLKGCIPDKEKRRFHSMGLHRPIACLNKILTSHLVIVDGIIGDLTFEEGGTPVRMNRVIAGKDPVLIDVYAAELLGYSVKDIEYIRIAEKMGIGRAQLSEAKIIELNKDQATLHHESTVSNTKLDYLRKWIVENQACSACYGSLIHALMRLKEKGKLKQLPQSIHIGQGFKGKKLSGIGVGICTKGSPYNIPGCPPKASTIVQHLEAWLRQKAKL
jgi:uncharacterized protein (DUF362 family)